VIVAVILCGGRNSASHQEVQGDAWFEVFTALNILLLGCDPVWDTSSVHGDGVTNFFSCGNVTVMLKYCVMVTDWSGLYLMENVGRLL
jgi:hypothetical protein